MLRQARFLICCAGALLIFQTHQGGVFYGAGLVALANLFTAQFMCGTQGCERPETRWMDRSPIALFYDATTMAGALFCVWGAIQIGWL
ncbi:MAG: hypothetical protein HQL80_10985 [Magnetococcales bacterium]|nr:hypothetical protein [Magnetococcales bacterium]